MKSNTLGLNLEQEVPRQFIRGQTLIFEMELPCNIQPNEMQDYIPSAELRRIQNAGEDGFIAALDCSWKDGSQHTVLTFLAHDTELWPLGPAEFDVLFTGTGNKEGFKFRSAPVQIEIVDGVTR